MSPDDRKLRRAARRKEALREGGLRAWMGHAATFTNRKREASRKACRGPVRDSE